MKFLAVYSATDSPANARPAKNGEPCVPNFGVCGRHLFLGLETDGLVSNAKPSEFPGELFGELFEKYMERYPALPKELLEKYFFASQDAAIRFHGAPRVKISHDNGKARFYSPETGTSMEVDLE